MDVDPSDLQTKETDDRGRLYLGTEFSNKRVTVAVVDVESSESDTEKLANAYRDAADRAASIESDWSAASNEAWSALDE